jgi:hypothetical protein
VTKPKKLQSPPPTREDDAFVWAGASAAGRSGTFPVSGASRSPTGGDGVVAGTPEDVAAESATQVARQPMGPRGMLQRAGGRVTRRMTMYLDPLLARRLVLFCAETGREISDVASEALERYLGAG